MLNSPRMVDGPFSLIRFCPSGEAGSGPSRVRLHRADHHPELAEPGLTEAEIFLVDDVDLAVPDDGRLIDRFQVILAVIGLEGDVHRLGQMLERGLDPDLVGVDLHRHVSEHPPAFLAVTVPPPRVSRDSNAEADIA